MGDAPKLMEKKICIWKLGSTIRNKNAVGVRGGLWGILCHYPEFGFGSIPQKILKICRQNLCILVYIGPVEDSPCSSCNITACIVVTLQTTGVQNSKPPLAGWVTKIIFEPFRLMSTHGITIFSYFRFVVHFSVHPVLSINTTCKQVSRVCPSLSIILSVM